MLTSLIVKFVPKTPIRRVILNAAFALSGVNHAANFFIYIVLSPRFRQLLVERLRRRLQTCCPLALSTPAARPTATVARRSRPPSTSEPAAVPAAEPPTWLARRAQRVVGPGGGGGGGRSAAALIAGRRSVVRAVESADSLDHQARLGQQASGCCRCCFGRTTLGGTTIAGDPESRDVTVQFNLDVFGEYND